MIRIGFILWPLCIVTVAIGLFQIKETVQGIDRQIRATEQKIVDLREKEAVLTTEWEYRTQPAALEALARSHLGMKGDLGTIVTSLDKLPYRQPGQSVLPVDQAWQSGVLSEQVDEAPALGLTALVDPLEPVIDTSMDDLQALISELEGM